MPYTQAPAGRGQYTTVGKKTPEEIAAEEAAKAQTSPVQPAPQQTQAATNPSGSYAINDSATGTVGSQLAPTAASGQNKNLGWPDALIGLANFMQATKRQRLQPPGVSTTGIGQPAPAGPLARPPETGKISAPGPLGSFL